jgi:cation transport ATPase
MPSSNPNPAPLRAIAWLSVATGVLMALLSALVLWLASAVPAAMPQAASELPALLGGGIDPKDMHAAMDQASNFFNQLRWLSIAQLPLAALVLWAGVDLLRRRAWARVANEVFCWLTLVGLALYALYAIQQWIGAPATPASDMQDLVGLDSAALRAIMFAVRAVVVVVCVFPTWAVLRYLRGPEARAACQSARAAGSL